MRQTQQEASLQGQQSTLQDHQSQLQGQQYCLEAAQRRISSSRNLVARQRALVRLLERRGHSTGRAEALLDVFEATLALMLSNHQRRGFPTFEGVTMLPSRRRSA
jgi:hypothetical protein